MKKFLTFILVLAMVLSVSSFAMAADLPAVADGKITLASDTYTLSGDVELSAGQYIEVPAGVTAVLDIGGTLKGTPSEAKAYAVIVNKGTLTIKGSGTVICKSSLAGSTGYALNTILNAGTLTIDGATIENKFEGSGAQIGYAIDNNSTNADAITNIKSGVATASGSVYYDGIRQFCNSETYKNEVNVSGGEVSSIWTQNPSDNTTRNTKEVNGSVSVIGGKVDAMYIEPSANFKAEITNGEIGKVVENDTANSTSTKLPEDFISGGIFGTEPADAFIADDAVAAQISTTDASGNTSTTYAVGQDTIEEAAEEAAEQSGAENVAVTITQGNVEFGDDLPDGAKVRNTGNGTVTVNGKTVAPNPDPSSEPVIVDNPKSTPAPENKPSGSGISVKYNGGNSFSTSNPSVPTGVEIDGVPVSFNGTGSNFTVGCISSDAKWVTVRWNSTTVTTNFTPDGLVECTTVSIPKTGDMPFWAAVAAFFGF